MVLDQRALLGHGVPKGATRHTAIELVAQDRRCDAVEARFDRNAGGVEAAAELGSPRRNDAEFLADLPAQFERILLEHYPDFLSLRCDRTKEVPLQRRDRVLVHEVIRDDATTAVDHSA